MGITWEDNGVGQIDVSPPASSLAKLRTDVKNLIQGIQCAGLFTGYLGEFKSVE